MKHNKGLRDMHTIQEKIIQYWTKRADSYSVENNEELAGTSTVSWLCELTSHFPRKKDLKVLDIGTGPGFMAILLSRAGYQVTVKTSPRKCEKVSSFHSLSQTASRTFRV